MESKSFFIVVEGIDGTGKTSLTHRLSNILGQHKHLKNRVKWTFEPHDPSCAGLFIRQVLMKKIRNVPLRTLALAFALNRADQCEREIGKFLGKPKRVLICDRYYLSSLVYQSGPDISFDEVMELNAGALKPDLTIFLEAGNSTCYKRMRKRKEDKELFEKNLNETKQKYREAIEFLESRGEKIVEINADGSMADVLRDVLDALKKEGPDWLKIQQYPLPVEIMPDIFEKNDLTVENAADQFESAWKGLSVSNTDELRDAVFMLRENISETIGKMPVNDVSNLFLDSLEQSGYRVTRELDLPDLPAFELEYELPLGMSQRGHAMILGRSQRYDRILKIVSKNEDKIRGLDATSHFLFVFDANPRQLVSAYYDEDVAQLMKKKLSLAPSTRVLGRAGIARIVFSKTMERFRNELSLDFCSAGEFDRIIRDLL